jgi:uncharacterized protein (TIGR02265 family)
VSETTMPADRTELARRLAAAAANDTSRGLNYAVLFSLVGDHLGASAAREVDVLGTARRVEFFSYPIAEYLRCAWNAQDRLEAVFGSPEAVLAELGRRTMAAFLDSLVGRCIFRLTGTDPRRMLEHTAFGYGAAVSYGERRVEFLGPARARAVFVRDFMPPAFHEASLLAGLKATRAVRPRVVGRAEGLLDSSYELSWE